MSNLHNERYDEIKNLIKISKLMLEQANPETRPNVAKDIEKKIEPDHQEYETADMEGEEEESTPRDKVQKYRISGGILALHGKDKGDLDITTDDKIAFHLEFTFTIGENSGIYINSQMVKVDQEFLDLLNKLQQYYGKFKSKWSRVLASRKKTKETNE